MSIMDALMRAVGAAAAGASPAGRALQQTLGGGGAFGGHGASGSWTPTHPGMIQPGNIDLNNRPIVRNADGSISTVRSMSFNFGGKEVLLPTVSPDGRILSPQQAIGLYRQTGQHLGVFKDPASANAYAQELHQSQAKQYLPKANGGFGGRGASGGW